MIEKRVSDNIKITSIICTLMVVYLHSLNYLAFFGEWERGGYNGLIQDGVLQLSRVAVPIFFIISGFFFFSKKYYSAEYILMLKKKCTTLLVPFIIWNLIGLPICAIFNRELIPSSFGSFIVQLCKSDWYGPLWYVRELMILMILAPLYQWIFIWKWRLYSIPVAVILLICFWHPIDFRVFSTEGLCFFLVGGAISAFISSCKNNSMGHSKSVRMLKSLMQDRNICRILIVFLIIMAFIPCWRDNIILQKLYIILTALFLFININSFSERLRSFIIKYSDYSFFIYVTHYYVIKLLKNIMGKYFYGSDIASVLSFILLPLITCYICVAIARIMKKSCRNIFVIITGNRA